MNKSADVSADRPVDLTELKKNVGGKTEVIALLVNYLLVDFPDKQRQLRQAFEQADSHQIRLISHTLKGSLGSLGAVEAQQLAYSMEVFGATGELAGVEQTLQQLEREIERIVVFFSDPSWVDKV